jgi:ABC-type transport system involved in multi-copper enzyme maturation permease subunit
MLLMVGALVGHGFITAVRLYAEVSGNGTGPAALPQALTPLDGILVPTWGAYDLAAMLLFPFVAIRLIASEKETGALKLLLQFPNSLGSKLCAKGIVLIAAWIIAWLPGLTALLLWRSYGGHLYGPETYNVLLGHLLRGLLSAGFAVAAAGISESAASAAIVTLGVTVGTWALDFVAAGRGGFLQQIASYTPTAVLRSFEHGLLQLNIVVVMLLLSVGCFAVAGIWLNTGQRIQTRVSMTVALLLVVGATAFAGSRLNYSWDLTENRRNSFPPADEQALSQIRQPLKITAFLAPEDPRLSDLEQSVVKKLKRVLPDLSVEYASNTTTGLFTDGEDHYGEIWYEMNGKRVMDRSTIPQVVLSQIYQLAGVNAPQSADEEDFPGYPLAANPKGAAFAFYLVWPALVILGWWLIRK